MHQHDIPSLASKYLAGQCTEEEQALVENWYLNWKPEEMYVDEERMLAAKAAVFARLPIHREQRSGLLWRRIASVAAVLLLFVSPVLFILSKYTDNNTVEIAAGSHDIAPGSKGARLTLANGKVITLSNAKNGVLINGKKLKYNDGTDLAEEIGGLAADGKPQIIKASTEKGQTYEITLPDGTIVWLNSASSIRFPSAFSVSGKRMVEITGEAYFEVSKKMVPAADGLQNERQAFEVLSGRQKVSVLGTHFNINSYADEQVIKTTLLEGSVRLTTAAGSIMLKPDQQATLLDTTFKIAEVQATDALDWKRGDFEFKKEPLSSIMRKLARWYNIEVVYEERVDKNRTFTGSVTRKKSISRVLEMMQTTGELKFKIEGRQVTVMK